MALTMLQAVSGEAIVDQYAGCRILVTGATGFIGRHLVADLVAKGCTVRALVRNANHKPMEWGTVKLFLGALEDRASLERACQGIDIVFHAAGFAHAWAHNATVGDMQRRTNIDGTRCLLQAAATGGVQRFIFFSSVKAMGPAGERCVDETWPIPPDTPYGQAKREAEGLVLTLGKRYGMHVVNLRLALVYGTGGRGNLERMIAAVRRGVFPPLPEEGNKRSLVHVKDVVQAALLAGINPVANQKTYIVTDGQTYSSRKIYELIRHAMGKPIPSWAVASSVLYALAVIGDILGRLCRRRMWFDSEALDKLLGWACYCSACIQKELGYQATLTLADALPEMMQEFGRRQRLA